MPPKEVMTPEARAAAIEIGVPEAQLGPTAVSTSVLHPEPEGPWIVEFHSVPILFSGAPGTQTPGSLDQGIQRQLNKWEREGIELFQVVPTPAGDYLFIGRRPELTNLSPPSSDPELDKIQPEQQDVESLEQKPGEKRRGKKGSSTGDT